MGRQGQEQEQQQHLFLILSRRFVCLLCTQNFSKFRSKDAQCNEQQLWNWECKMHTHMWYSSLIDGYDSFKGWSPWLLLKVSHSKIHTWRPRTNGEAFPRAIGTHNFCVSHVPLHQNKSNRILGHSTPSSWIDSFGGHVLLVAAQYPPKTWLFSWTATYIQHPHYSRKRVVPSFEK